jgi:hypothetical protein
MGSHQCSPLNPFRALPGVSFFRARRIHHSSLYGAAFPPFWYELDSPSYLMKTPWLMTFVHSISGITEGIQ